jgi:hypothetical protein
MALALVLGLSGTSAVANEPGSVAREAARDLGVQTKLPAGAAEDRFEPSDFHLDLPENVADIILWSAIIAGTCLILWAMRDSLPSFRGAGPRDPLVDRQASLLPISVERLEEAGIDADELARDGRVVEAMHLLLLRSFAELKRSLDLRFADSLTSREILSRLPIPTTALEALSDIVARVELAYFGNRFAGTEDYRVCRRSFAQLTRGVRAATNG